MTVLQLVCDIKVKLATVVEGNPKAPFSIATTPKCRGGRYSFPYTKSKKLVTLIENDPKAPLSIATSSNPRARLP